MQQRNLMQQNNNNEDLNTLKEAIRLSSSSYGLQPIKLLLLKIQN
jgi:hypothetical protein